MEPITVSNEKVRFSVGDLQVVARRRDDKPGVAAYHDWVVEPESSAGAPRLQRVTVGSYADAELAAGDMLAAMVEADVHEREARRVISAAAARLDHRFSRVTGSVGDFDGDR